MILNLWESIRDFFMNLFESVSFTSILTLMTGIIIGILFSLMVYVITILKSVKNKEKENAFNKNNIIKNDLGISQEEELELIEKYIETSKSQFLEESEEMKAFDKFNLMKEICINLATDVAKIYYPKSQYPLFELSIDELIQLDYYIVGRIESVLNKGILKKVKKVKVSMLLDFYDKKKKLDNNKIVKAAKKLNVGGVGSVVMGALNIINPAYWLKKVGPKFAINIILNKLYCIAISIVGEETAKIYSKNAFIKIDNSDVELLFEEDENMERE